MKEQKPEKKQRQKGMIVNYITEEFNAAKKCSSIHLQDREQSAEKSKLEFNSATDASNRDLPGSNSIVE